MLIIQKLIKVREEDIHSFRIAKSQNEYASIVNNNMISSALKGAKLFPNWDVLVLPKKMIIQRYNLKLGEMQYYWSKPIEFCDILAERLKMHDDREFLKIKPFDMRLTVWYTRKEELTPYVNLGNGLLECMS